MCNREATWPPTETGTGTLVDRLITQCGALPADHITVAGKKTLDVLLGLCGRGFVHATCCTSPHGPHDAHDRATSLWILNAENAAEMRTLIASHGHDLHANGTLIVNLDFLNSPEKGGRLQSILTQCGFMPMRQFHANGRVFLLCVRTSVAIEAAAA